MLAPLSWHKLITDMYILQWNDSTCQNNALVQESRQETNNTCLCICTQETSTSNKWDFHYVWASLSNVEPPRCHLAAAIYMYIHSKLQTIIYTAQVYSCPFVTWFLNVYICTALFLCYPLYMSRAKRIGGCTCTVVACHVYHPCFSILWYCHYSCST